MAEKKALEKVQDKVEAGKAEAKKTVKKVQEKVQAKAAANKAEVKKTAQKVQDKVAADKIEAKKTVRKAARDAKEAVSESAAKAVGDVKDNSAHKKMLKEIEKKKSKAQSERKAEEKKIKTAAKKEAAKKPIAKVKAARMNIVFQSPMGGSITPEQIAEKVPAGATDVYVRIDENKIYWVNKKETGSTEIW